MRYVRHARRGESRAALIAKNLKRRAPVEAAPVEAPAEEVGAWPLKMPPETYLALHADGKHAALARQLLELEGS